MTETEMMSDEQLKEIEARKWEWTYAEPHNQQTVRLTVPERNALCQTVRALRDKLKGAKVKMGKWEFTEDELEQQYLDATRLGAATSMRSRCVEKVGQVRRNHGISKNQDYEHGFSDALNCVETALKGSPALDQVGQEKQRC